MADGRVNIVPLEDLPLAIDPAAIDRAIAPFLVADGTGPGWSALLARRARRTMLRAARRALRLGNRHRTAIEKEYRRAWGAGYDRYRLDRTDLKPAPWIWRDRRLLLDQAAATRMRMVMVGAAIAELKPRSVLEVGCGNGINLLTLAGAFPDIAFTGIDLTDEGVAQAGRAQRDPAILDIIAAYSPFDRFDRDSVGRIAFRQASAAQLPFADGEYDLVITLLAVEQMEGIRKTALDEIARVAGSHVLMLEPFAERNNAGLRKLYVWARDYFRGGIAQLPDHGLNPVWATADYPEEAFLGTALVCSRKDARPKA